MKPVLILQHLSSDGPAYLASWLQRHGLPFELRNTEAGEDFPEHMDSHAALAILGGEMSANDSLPSLRRAELLILDAMARGRPVVGHCLGGQLMARALGARIVSSPLPEVGWHEVSLFDAQPTRDWFGIAGSATVFQWHEDAFELPLGAIGLAGNASCKHQAFAIGPHLAMQFHVEVDEEKLYHWSMLDTEAYRVQQREHATVHSGATMREAMALHLPVQQALADRVYARWWAAAAGN